MRRLARWAGWKLMGYPFALMWGNWTIDAPGWTRIYRTGARVFDWGDVQKEEGDMKTCGSCHASFDPTADEWSEVTFRFTGNTEKTFLLCAECMDSASDGIHLLRRVFDGDVPAPRRVQLTGTISIGVSES